MVEIKPGAELDLAVAEACGVKGWIESLRHEATGYESPKRFVLSSMVDTVFWEPSTDLNAAFLAAEKVGLFDQWHIGKWSNPPQSGWGIEGDGSPVSGLYPTPSLAICAAILELANA